MLLDSGIYEVIYTFKIDSVAILVVSCTCIVVFAECVSVVIDVVVFCVIGDKDGRIKLEL